MRHVTSSSRHVAACGAVVAVVLCATLAGCSFSDKLLQADHPNLIDPKNLNSPEGADALRFGAISRLSDMTTQQESTWLFGGLLADEWSSSSTFFENDETDGRTVSTSNASVRTQYRQIHRTRTAANQAIAALQKYRPTLVANIAEMYMARGFAEMQLAQDFCNGQPLSDAAGDSLALGAPLTVQQIFTRAVATFDTALAIDTDTSSAGTRIRNATKIARARALMGLGKTRFADAAAAVAGVPTTYSYQITISAVAGTNAIWAQNNSAQRYSLADSVEGNNRNILVRNALPFYSAHDPRLPANDLLTPGQDGRTFVRVQHVYNGPQTSTDLVDGIDARLVEAESKLNDGQVAAWLAILNTLRATTLTLGDVTYQANALPPLTDPGVGLAGDAADQARVSLQFREKAFWTFTRGQRLGDLRRLIRQYGRTEDQVFPTGVWYKGTSYGHDVNFPVPQTELNNPNFHGCTDRNA